MRRFVVLLVFVLSGKIAAADQRAIDSLNKVLASDIHDTVKVNTLNELSFETRSVDPAIALEHAESAMKLAEEIKFERGVIWSLQRAGGAYYFRKDYSAAINSYLKAGERAKKGGLKVLEANAYGAAGRAAFMADDLVKASEYFLKALVLYEKVNDKSETINTLSNLALVYSRQNNLEKALEYHQQCLAMELKAGDIEGSAITIDHIGTIYKKMRQLDKAMLFYERALAISDSVGNEHNSSVTLHNIAAMLEESRSYPKALEYYQRSLAIKEKLGNTAGIMKTLHNIGYLYNEANMLMPALQYLNRSLALAIEQKSREYQKHNYYVLSKVYQKGGNLQAALIYRDKYEVIRDSLYNEDITRQITEMQARYESDKKEKEIKLLNQEKQLQEAEIFRNKAEVRTKNMQRNFFISGFALMLVLSGFTYKAYRAKRKANNALHAKNEEILLQKTVIEEKNKDITDSINYARRIQQAILPPHEQIAGKVKEFFCLYRPKDIVSGDFYYFAEESEKLIFAVADCTGHGVPGAFMSLIGNDLLNQIILEKKVTRPSEILGMLHDGVRFALKQSNGSAESNDGMDIAVCALNRNTGELEYAGALRNLLLLKKGEKELLEVKADKSSIGGVLSDVRKEFNNHVIELKPGDAFYMTSDGFADQFGGEEGKKFLSRRFRDSLWTVRFLKMKEQEKYLNEAFEKWKGQNEQVDDVCVLGVRV